MELEQMSEQEIIAKLEEAEESPFKIDKDLLKKMEIHVEHEEILDEETGEVIEKRVKNKTISHGKKEDKEHHAK